MQIPWVALVLKLHLCWIRVVVAFPGVSSPSLVVVVTVVSSVGSLFLYVLYFLDCLLIHVAF